MSDVPNKNSSVDEITNYLRHTPEYITPHTYASGILHPFHRRYHAKPEIFDAAILGFAHLCRFKSENKEAEFLEIQEDGLTKKVFVFIADKQYEFRTVIEAECFIADYLSGD